MTRKWANMDAQARREQRLNHKARGSVRRLHKAFADLDHEFADLDHEFVRPPQPWYRRWFG